MNVLILISGVSLSSIAFLNLYLMFLLTKERVSEAKLISGVIALISAIGCILIGIGV